VINIWITDIYYDKDMNRDFLILISFHIYFILLVFVMLHLVTCLFFLVLLVLTQRWSPPLRLQVSDCSNFRIRCDVTRIAVFCSDTIRSFLDLGSNVFNLCYNSSDYSHYWYGYIFDDPLSPYLYTLIIIIIIIIIVIIIISSSSSNSSSGCSSCSFRSKWRMWSIFCL
jgi:hypothetical protein